MAHDATSSTSFEGAASERMGGVRRLLTVLSVGSGGLLLALAMCSRARGEAEPWAGPLGEAVSGVLFGAFGVAAWLLPVESGWWVWRLWHGRPAGLGRWEPVAILAEVLAVGAVARLLQLPPGFGGGPRAGGASGELLGELLRSVLGVPGALLVLGATCATLLIVRAPEAVWGGLRLLRRGAQAGGAAMRRFVESVREAWRLAAEMETSGTCEAVPDEEGALPSAAADPEASGAVAGTLRDAAVPVPSPATHRALPEGPASEVREERDTRDTGASRAQKAEGERLDGARLRIVAPRAESGANRAALPTTQEGMEAARLPGPELYDEPPVQHIDYDEAALAEQADVLVRALRDYGVHGEVEEVHPGPVVTMFEFTPRSGTKLSKIAALADDMAMALAVERVRIVAPIPGKGRVGFELPSPTRQTVWLRSLLEDPRWGGYRAALPMVLGRDITGRPVYVDLAAMPHLLVAGATGAGKSVGVNVMLLSMLSRLVPEELKLLMIDPKAVELAVFEGIPHMLLPVVTQPDRAARALRWAVDEMERRYQLFAEAGTRNVDGYNKLVRRFEAGELPLERFRRRKKGREESEPIERPARLPRIVVVVDEFADLVMSTSGKDVEASIARLAQKARAAGIHVLLATQRPSTDVITGMVKANFPARIAFSVRQRQDSMVVLGSTGAEHLLGKGDMLFQPPGSGEPRRVHGAFVSEEEVHRVCEFLREQGEPHYDERILAPREDEESGGSPEGDDRDADVYERARVLVVQAGFCSTSFLQRKLGIGYNRAARIVDRLEQAGVVGPPTKAGGRREVFVTG